MLRLSFNLFCDKIIGMIKKTKLFIIISCILFSSVICNQAVAIELSKQSLTASLLGFVGGIYDFVGFFGDTVVGKVRKDFCVNYYSSIANGEWKPTELRVVLGSRVCTEKVAIKIDTADKKNNTKAVEPVSINIKPKATEIKTPIVSKIQSITKKVENSGILVGKTSLDSVKINSAQILSLTNIERVEIGLTSLVGNRKLDTIAEERVMDMFNKSYFEHVSPTGDSASLVAERNGYKYIVIGENIALGNFDNTQALITAWMNSEGHRKNILHSAYTEIGIYAKEGTYKGQKVWISAQIFGKPLSSCVEPSVKTKEKIQSIQSSLSDMKKRADNITIEFKNINSSENPNFYNAKLAEHNILVSMINSSIKELNSLASEYNAVVRVFNECVK